MALDRQVSAKVNLVACFFNVMLILALVVSTPAQAKRYDIKAPQHSVECNEQFETIANRLKPGDELVLAAGSYSQACRRAISIQGTKEAPIVIRGVGQVVVAQPRENLEVHNNVEFIDLAHVHIRNIHFRGGSIGVRFMGLTEHVIFENNKISSTGTSALTANQGDSHFMVIRGNEISDTGNASGETEGEGLYLGCNQAACEFSNGIIEGNYIHDLKATSGGGNDGIELKPGSGGNIVRNNLIHHTITGREFPCLFAYGGGRELNLIENNIVHHCGEAIQVVADAIVRGNLVLDSTIAGILVEEHKQIGRPRNLQISHNTVVGHPVCLKIAGQGITLNDIEVSNNVLICSGETALDARRVESERFANNIVVGKVQGQRFSAAQIKLYESHDQLLDDWFVDYRKLDYRPTLSAPFRLARAVQHSTIDANGLMRDRSAFVTVGAFVVLDSADVDADGIVNALDNCLQVSNPLQLDRDNDRIGNLCDPDITGDGWITAEDFVLFADDFAEQLMRSDFNHDERVDFIDWHLMINYYQRRAGPTGFDLKP